MSSKKLCCLRLPPKLPEWPAYLAQARLYFSRESLPVAVELVLEEVVVNLIEHTSLAKQGKCIEILIEELLDGWKLTFKHFATPFDWKKAVELLQSNPLPPPNMEMAMGGQGLKIIAHYTKQLDYRIENGMSILEIVL